MPIFVSRFSPDRGLVGLMQSLRVRGNVEEQTTQAASPEEDVRRAEQAAQEKTQAAQESSSFRTDQSGGNAQAGEAQGQSAVDGRDGLSAVGNTGLALTLDISGTEEANRISNQQAAESTDQADVGGIAQQLQDQIESQGTEDVDGAALSADPEAQPAPVAEEQGGAEQTVDAQGAEQDGTAREGQVDQAAEEEQKAVPPAEVQREQVRSAAREIGSGLRRDAEIQNSRNVEETSRNVAHTTEGSKRQEVRQSQAEARNLQAERRQLQQEVRRTEQQIRQLQGRASGAGGAAAAKAVNTVLSGSSVNILAQ
ncbi:MAG: hypothetical protein EXS64_14550 [Candidatus Latescibacteria bacterium]|nr:hypothetical protein [Candidatus Latescibacterota bacterium]